MSFRKKETRKQKKNPLESSTTSSQEPSALSDATIITYKPINVRLDSEAFSQMNSSEDNAVVRLSIGSMEELPVNIYPKKSRFPRKDRISTSPGYRKGKHEPIILFLTVISLAVFLVGLFVYLIT